MGCVEETGSVGTVDYVKEHRMGDTCNEVADIFGTGERRHRVAVGPFGILHALIPFFSLRSSKFHCVGVGLAAAGDAGIG